MGACQQRQFRSRDSRGSGSGSGSIEPGEMAAAVAMTAAVAVPVEICVVRWTGRGTSPPVPASISPTRSTTSLGRLFCIFNLNYYRRSRLDRRMDPVEATMVMPSLTRVKRVQWNVDTTEVLFHLLSLTTRWDACALCQYQVTL